VWAEDGRFFLEDEFNHGPIGSLFLDYSGYLHVVPRMVISFATHAAPIDRFAVTVTVLCALVVGAVCAGVYVLTEDVLRSVAVRLVLAALPALLPLAPVEIAGNTANLHTYLLFLAPFVFIAPVRSWARSVVLAVVALLSGLTEIQILAFLPLLLLQIRMPKKWPIVAGALLGVGAQVLTTIVYPRRTLPDVGHGRFSDIAVGFFLEPFAGSGTWDIASVAGVVADSGLVVLIVPFAVVLAVVVVGMWLGTARHRILLGAMVWGAGVVWAVSVYVNAVPVLAFAHFTESELRSISTFRYAAASSLFIIAGVLVVADVLVGRRGILLKGVGALLTLVVVVVFAINFSVPETSRQHGPVWDQQVDQAEDDCELHPRQNAVIQVAPSGPNWATTVPCKLVLDR